jgi:cell division septation protein DedD
MSDTGFREIQLSGKQVVFLFMAGAVAAVAVFLLGVSVGRQVPPNPTAESTPPPVDATADAGAPGSLPPPTAPAPGELKYDETLRGKPEGGTAAPPPVTSTPTPTPTPTSTPAPTGSPAPVKPTATPPSTAKPTPTARPTPPPASASRTAVWFVQVSSFGSRANASRQVSELKAKGIDARVFTVPGTNTPYRVRVGPLERAAADAMYARLQKEGLKPSPPSR